MSVPTTAKLLNFWTFGKILSHLRKNIRGHMHSPWRSECSWRGHLRAPQNGQNRALVKKRELNLGNICRHIFVHVYFRAISQNMKIKLSPAPELNFCGPVPLKKRFTDLHWVSSFCEFCLTRIEYVGVRAARNAAHSTSSAYSDGGRPQKKTMGKSKKCALTVKQVSVTTWSLTNEKKRLFF